MARSIFIVEDDPALRALLTQHLRGGGYEVLEAGDAESAVQHLVQAPPFDLLITDVHLPDLSGIELLRLLQAHSPRKPVLVITGDDDTAIARAAIESGATSYILKPFELSELDAGVAQALRHLELLERVGEAEPGDARKGEFGVPAEWLEIADARSGAGPGHSRRVERLATVLAKQNGFLELDDLATAARLHEIGLLVGPSRCEGSVPLRSSQILEHTTVGASVRALIARMGSPAEAFLEPGTTTLPDVLRTADRIDHDAMKRVDEGTFPPTAIMQALEDVSTGHPAGPARGALEHTREVLSAVWILSRGGYPMQNRHGPGATEA